MTAQLVATLIVALICWVVWKPGVALAALLGGGCVALPAGYLAWRAGRERSPQKLLVMGFGKFISTCALLAIAMVLIQPSPVGFFAALIIAQLMYVLIPLAAGHRAGSQR